MAGLSGSDACSAGPGYANESEHAVPNTGIDATAHVRRQGWEGIRCSSLADALAYAVPDASANTFVDGRRRGDISFPDVISHGLPYGRADAIPNSDTHASADTVPDSGADSRANGVADAIPHSGTHASAHAVTDSGANARAYAVPDSGAD